MNKLYILGALALTQADAYVAWMAVTGDPVNTLTGATALLSFATTGLAGSYTYTYTADCLGSGALTTLGMNNNYY